MPRSNRRACSPCYEGANDAQSAMTPTDNTPTAISLTNTSVSSPRLRRPFVCQIAVPAQHETTTAPTAVTTRLLRARPTRDVSAAVATQSRGTRVACPRARVSEFEVLVDTGRGPCRRGTVVRREEARRSSRREPPAAHGSWACALLARTCRPVSAAALLLERLGCRRRARGIRQIALLSSDSLVRSLCGSEQSARGTRRGLRHSSRRGSTLINRADPFQADAQSPVGGHEWREIRIVRLGHRATVVHGHWHESTHPSTRE